MKYLSTYRMNQFSHNEMFRIILEILVSTDMFSPLINNSNTKQLTNTKK